MSDDTRTRLAPPTDPLERGREAFERGAWTEAYEELSSADAASPLRGTDLDRLAVAAHLTARDEECAEAWERAHLVFLEEGAVARAARCAFWLGFAALHRGEMGRSGGWFARAQRLLDDGDHDCVEQGYLLFPVGLRAVIGGDPATGYTTFGEAAAIAAQFGDRDLATLAHNGQGRALIRLGDIDRGIALLDETMVAITAGEVSPIITGHVYCSMIEACQEVFDLPRAGEWTAALTRWCESQPDLVPYRGQCLVHRSQLLGLRGQWPAAMGEARRACERLLDPPGQPAAGMAFYQRGELHRLRGEFAEAEQAYRTAGRFGRDPQPGLALLRLAQGQIGAAEAAIRHVVDAAEDRETRSKVLTAFVEIMLAAGNVSEARRAADELQTIADELDAPLLEALSAHTLGAVLLAEGQARAALDVLRRAWRTLQQLETPYEAARVRVLLAAAYRELADPDTAALELEEAGETFRRLGAAPDVTRVESLERRSGRRAADGLTDREVEVLRLAATGRTNREIAAELVLSEHTVRRHLQNIFAKLGVTSRAAATAYAYEHGIL